jgi:hypothetical protein
LGGIAAASFALIYMTSARRRIGRPATRVLVAEVAVALCAVYLAWARLNPITLLASHVGSGLLWGTVIGLVAGVAVAFGTRRVVGRPRGPALPRALLTDGLFFGFGTRVGREGPAAGGTAMLTDIAVVPTDHATRHLEQLCRHAGQMRDSRHLRHLAGWHVPPELRSVESTDTRGVLEFQDGRCVIEAGPDALTLRVDAADLETLERIRDLLRHRVETIGSRDRLKVTWQSPDL